MFSYGRRSFGAVRSGEDSGVSQENPTVKASHAEPVRPHEILRDAVQLIAPLADIDQVGNALLELLTPHYDLSFFGFSAWEDDRGLFVERLFRPSKGEPVHLRVEDLDDYGFGQAIKTGQPRLVEDIQKEAFREGEWEARRRFGTRSYITLPFRILDRVAGALGLGSAHASHFRPQDVDALEPVAELLGLKLMALGATAPLTLVVPSLPSLQPIRLFGRNPTLWQRVEAALPEGVPVERFTGLSAGPRGGSNEPIIHLLHATAQSQGREFNCFLAAPETDQARGTLWRPSPSGCETSLEAREGVWSPSNPCYRSN